MYESLPARERGLKRRIQRYNLFVGRSLPARERGLKPHMHIVPHDMDMVAPRAGARIETTIISLPTIRADSRSPRGERGLKLETVPYTSFVVQFL